VKELAKLFSNVGCGVTTSPMGDSHSWSVGL